jgi:hypothetical protein
MMIVRSLKQHFPARFPEWLNAGILSLWSIYVLFHPEMFVNAPTAALFAHMVVMAHWWGVASPALAWGLSGLVVGLFRTGALLVNGLHTRTPLIRLGTSFASAFIWTQIIVGLWRTGIPNTGLIVYGGLVFADLCSAYRAGCDVTWAEHHRKVETGDRVRSSNVIA